MSTLFPFDPQTDDRLAAYSLGVDDQYKVAAYRWARDTCSDQYDATTFRAWLFGTNSHLEGNAPAKALRDGDVPGFVTAMKAFLCE